MEAESIVFGVTADRSGEPFLGRFGVWATVAALLLAPAAAHAADPGGAGLAGKGPAVMLESVPGSTIPRVVLAAKAAERLGIETGKVSEESVVRKQMVSGLIVLPKESEPGSKPGGGGFRGFGKVASAPEPQTAAGSAPAPKMGNVGFGSVTRMAVAPVPQPVAPKAAAQARLPHFGEVWVFVALSPVEWERLAKDRPARLMPLATRESSAKELLAQPSGVQPDEDTKRSMLRVHFVVPGNDHGLAVNDRVRVELPVSSGSDEKQKVVPYSAVYYDAKGNAWVYVNGKPLTFQRERIAVERVVGDLAVLSEGPAVGTSVVTVGAALLYGSEIFKK